MRVVFMGPPGAGKGTQASLLAATLGVPHISTGDIFRANVAEGTELGRQAQRYMDAGEYVPDSVTNGMVRDRLTYDDCRPGFLLDGYPRTVEQVAELDAMLRSAGQHLDLVVELTVDIDEVGRSDDTEEVIRRRLEVYAEQTAPLIETYSDRGLLVRVDGMGLIEEVTERLVAVVVVD
jgi:adenylate kinase